MKRKLIGIICAVLTVLNFCCVTGFCSGDIADAVSQITVIRKDKSGDVTLTDVRKNAASVSQDFSKDEIEEILIMINDYYKGNFGDEAYYETICENLSASDIETAVEAIKNPEPVSTLNVGLIAGIAGGVVGVGAVAVVLVVILKKSGNGNAKTQKSVKSEVKPVYNDVPREEFSAVAADNGSAVNSGTDASTNANENTSEEAAADWEDYF